MGPCLLEEWYRVLVHIDIILYNRNTHCWFFNLCLASQTTRCVDSRTSIQSTMHYAVPLPTFLNRNRKIFTEQKQSAVKMELNTSINALWKIRRGKKGVIQSPKWQFDAISFVHWQQSSKNQNVASTMTNRMPETALENKKNSTFSTHSVQIRQLVTHDVEEVHFIHFYLKALH